MHLLDANTLIRAHADYYALDRVPPFWEWLDHHARAGAVKMPLEMFDEVAGGGQPRPGELLIPYLRQAEVKRALVLHEEVNSALVTQVLAGAYGGANPTEIDLEDMGQDPFLLAYALAEPGARVVVTCETSKPTKRGPRRKIPDACADLGLRCIGPFQLFRELDFSLDWRERLAPAP